MNLKFVFFSSKYFELTRFYCMLKFGYINISYLKKYANIITMAWLTDHKKLNYSNFGCFFSAVMSSILFVELSGWWYGTFILASPLSPMPGPVCLSAPFSGSWPKLLSFLICATPPLASPTIVKENKYLFLICYNLK